MDELRKANDGKRNGALFSGRAGDTMRTGGAVLGLVRLGGKATPPTHTQEHVRVVIRVLESRVRRKSHARFGAGERPKGPTYHYSVPVATCSRSLRYEHRLNSLAGSRQCR